MTKNKVANQSLSLKLGRQINILNKTITLQKMHMIKLWFLNLDLNLEICSSLIKFLIMNIIWFCKMISTLKVTLNGFTLESAMLEKGSKLSLTCWIWSKIKVFIMMEWKCWFILWKDNRKLKNWMIFIKNKIKRIKIILAG